MTTFNNALANLQNNSNRMAALAKGYNTDVAKFQTKKAKDTARLFLLAGEMGKEISSRLAERKAKEEESEKTWQLFNDSYLGKTEIDPEFKESIFKVSADQRTYSNLISNAERNKQISPYVATKTNNSAGVGERALEQQKLGSIAIEFTPWYHHQVKTNTGTFDAVILLENGTLDRQTFNINDPNLPREARFARLQYLTKQYVGNTVSGYDSRFLTYSPENGGSGFATSIMQQSDTIKQEIEKNWVSAEGINDRSNAITIFQDSTATASEIADAYTLIMNSGAKDGEGLIQRDKAWKFLHDNLKKSVEEGYISYERLEEIVDMELFNINGKKTLAQYDPARYGKFDKGAGIQGSMFDEADKFKTEQNTKITERNENQVVIEFEKLESEILDGALDPRNKVDLEAIEERLRTIYDIAIDNNIEFDYAAKLKALQQLPNTETKPIAKLAVKNYFDEKTTSSMRMSIVSQQFSEDVQATSDIQSIISLEQKMEDENKDDIDLIANILQKVELVESGGTIMPQYTWPNSSASTLWELEKGRLLRLLVKNDQLPAGEKQLPKTIIDNFKNEIIQNKAAAKIDKTWIQYDEEIAQGKSTIDPTKQALVNTSIYASDIDGHYRNAENHKGLKGNFTHGWKSEMYQLKLAGSDLTSPKTFVKEEQKFISKYPVNPNDEVKTLDFNKLIQGSANEDLSDIEKIANLQNISMLEYFQQRAQSVGQELNEKSLEILCADIANNCSAKVKKKIEKGDSLTHSDNANISKTCPTAGILSLYYGGEEGEKIANAAWKYLCKDVDVIDYTTASTPLYLDGLETYAKLNLGLAVSAVDLFGPSAKFDLELDGAEKIMEQFSLIPKPDLLRGVLDNDFACFTAYEQSGDIKFCPKLDSPLLEDSKASDFQKLVEELTRFDFTDFEEEEDDEDNNKEELPNTNIQREEINSIKKTLD